MPDGDRQMRQRLIKDHENRSDCQERPHTRKPASDGFFTAVSSAFGGLVAKLSLLTIDMRQCDELRGALEGVELRKSIIEQINGLGEFERKAYLEKKQEILISDYRSAEDNLSFLDQLDDKQYSHMKKKFIEKYKLSEADFPSDLKTALQEAQYCSKEISSFVDKSNKVQSIVI